MNLSTRLLPLGDAALTIELGQTIDAVTHQRVMGYCRALAEAKENGALAAVSEWAPAFCSVTVYFDCLLQSFEDISPQLLALVDNIEVGLLKGRRWRIPILFDLDAAPDLPMVAAHCNMSPDEVVRQLAAAVFRVYVLGFMPGFPYMGGLPQALAVPRLSTPRKTVPERSLAIAGNMCTIYPWSSPGGWRLVGRSPLRLFAHSHPHPALFAPGDEVTWQAIDAEQFMTLQAEDQADRLDRNRFIVEHLVA